MANLPQSGIWNAKTIYWNYGSPDPSGPYPKPDINICAPAGQAITALLPGVVSNVRDTRFGDEIGNQPTVTVQIAQGYLPNPYAQYSAYTHLDSAAVHEGQSIKVGDIIGYAKGQGVCTAFALTNVSPYGAGDFTGNPLLDATQTVLNAISGHTAQGTATLAYQSGSGVPVIGPLIDWLNNFTGQFGQTLAWLFNPLRIIKLVAGLALILLALLLLVWPAMGEVVAGVYKKAMPIVSGGAIKP